MRPGFACCARAAIGFAAGSGPDQARDGAQSQDGQGARRFCGLSIENKIPDHSVFSRARNERFRESAIFRRVFERVVEACIAAGLVGGEVRHYHHDCRRCPDNMVQEDRRTMSRIAPEKDAGRRPRGRRGMRTLIAAVVAVSSLAGTGFAAEPQACEIPGNLLFGTHELKRVEAAVNKDRRLTIAVVGTGSSILVGPDGRSSAYPARLEAALKHRLPTIAVKVATLVRTRQTAEDLAQGMGKLLINEKPDLVIWQTGTFDAIRRIDPDIFRAALDRGVDTLHDGGTDVILMNMQYSPRTDIMIALGPYADSMHVVADQKGVPLFNRLAIMRHWSDTGAFDLYAAGMDNVLAQRVHDCIGRAIASMIIEAAHLKSVEFKTGQ